MRTPPPAPGVLVAAAVTAVQGAAVTGFGGWLVVQSLVSVASNSSVAWGSAVYFLVLGPLVLVVAAALWRRRSWSLGAAVFVQLIALLVAFSMLQGGFVLGGVPLALAAVGAIAALLRPDSRASLGRD